MKKGLLSLFAFGLLFGAFGAVTHKAEPVDAEAAGPYKIVGAFNSWSTTTNTKNLTEFTTTISNQKVYYAKHTIYGEWKVKNLADDWISAGNLNDQARSAGFTGSGQSNIASPDTTSPGSEYTFFFFESDDRINAVKGAYLVGTMNSWTTGDETQKFTQNSTQPWYYSLDFTLDAGDAFKLSFGSNWTGALGAGSLTQDSKDYGFAGTDNIERGTAPLGNYNITLDIVNFLVDIVPTNETATALASEIMGYTSGDISTPECATKYSTMKTKVVALNATQKYLFQNSTDSNISSARLRYTQWAIANNDLSGMYSSGGGSGVAFAKADEVNISIILTLAILSISSLAGFYFLKKKRQNS